MILFVLLLNFLHADVILNNNISKIENFKMTYYYDASSSLGVNEILKRDFNKTFPNKFSLGFFKGTYWLKLLLRNNSSQENFLLSLGMPWFDVVNLYSFKNGKIIENKNGLSVPFKEIEIPDTNPTFSLHVNKGESKVFYIQMRCKFGASGNFTLYINKVSYVKDKVISIGLYMIYLGGSIIVILLNLFLFFTLREKIYLYYSCYVLTLASFIMVMAGISGYIFYNLYYALNSIAALNMLFFILFAKEILQTPKYTPRLNMVLNIFGIIFFLFVPLIFLYTLTWFQLFNNIIVVALFLILISAILSWKRGNADAKYYIIFMILYISALLIFSLLSLGYIEYNYFTRYIFIYASFFEISFFALVLANRFHKTREEKIAIEIRLQDKELYEVKLEEESYRDALTRLSNRRYLINKSTQLFKEISLKKENLCVLMLDIDYFKSVNDTYGHLVGDTVLKNVANILNNFGRKDDIVARYGGEEFIVIVSNTTIEDAKIIAEKIRKNIEELDSIYEEDKILKVTISIGVSQLTEEDGSIEDIINRADKGLYNSKKEGRNRVSIY